jgi:anti-sigma regulatory factor (Ser/Thr protein kinase)
MSAPVRHAATTASTSVRDSSQVGEARRAAGAACRALGLGEDEAGRAGIVTTEAASNVVRHGGGGEILIQPMAGAVRGIEIVALDRGPGIADMARAFADGHSTGGTPGTGLGAMRRLSSRFDAYSQPGHGTAMLMQIRADEAATPPIVSGGVCLPKAGETQCGDVWDAGHGDTGYRITLADGLGHGPLAREAALTAVGASHSGPPGRALEDAHLASRATRGAALALAEVELARGTVRYAAIGNVSAVLWMDGSSRSLVSMNGIVGQGLVKFREFLYPFDPGALLVMSSDGLGSRWAPDRYPGLYSRHPALVAAVLYRDHARGTDDTTVVVARLGCAR